MGMVIFESSGVFNPGKYGLSPGDLIQIVCVGGGASGAGAGKGSYFPGSAGGASSFGSILSAAGGTAMSGGFTNILYVSHDVNSNNVGVYDHYFAGWPGQGGWLPGVGALYSFSPSVIVTEGSMLSCAPSYGKGATSWGGRCTAGTGTGTVTGTAGSYMGVGSRGSAGSGYYANSDSGYHYYYAAGTGGSGGYGAAGPGGCCADKTYGVICAYGGNAGRIKTLDYAITSMAEIAVTVGAGGTASGSAVAAGGAGAPGCVAVFW